MGVARLLVTVAGNGGRVDLDLAGEATVAQVLPALVARCALQAPPWSRWSLAPRGGEPFPPQRSLEELGVVDGAELELSDETATEPGSPPAPLLHTALQSPADAHASHRRALVALVERMAGDIARLQAGGNPLLDYASSEARQRLRRLLPATLDAGPPSSITDLNLSVRWPRRSATPVTATALIGDRAGRRISVRLLASGDCRSLAEVTVSASEPPPSPGARGPEA